MCYVVNFRPIFTMEECKSPCCTSHVAHSLVLTQCDHSLPDPQIDNPVHSCMQCSVPGPTGVHSRHSFHLWVCLLRISGSSIHTGPLRAKPMIAYIAQYIQEGIYHNNIIYVRMCTYMRKNLVQQVRQRVQFDRLVRILRLPLSLSLSQFFRATCTYCTAIQCIMDDIDLTYE